MKMEPTLAAMSYDGLSKSLDELTAAMGSMERINNTPLPYIYVGHLRVFPNDILYKTYVCMKSV